MFHYRSGALLLGLLVACGGPEKPGDGPDADPNGPTAPATPTSDTPTDPPTDPTVPDATEAWDLPTAWAPTGTPPADNCPLQDNPDQADADGDWVGDACDACSVPGDGLGLFGPEHIVPVPSSGYLDTVVAADFDGDGLLDLASFLRSDCYGTVSGLLLWRATETWWEVPEIIDPAGSGTLASGDVDGDGDPDIVLATGDSQGLRYLENVGGGTFAPSVFIGGTDAAQPMLADLDGDGDPDLVVGNDSGRAIVTFENLGGGAFGPLVSLLDGLSRLADLAPVDVDGDGDPDVVATTHSADPTDTLVWIENQGDGSGPATTVFAGKGEDADHVAGGDLDGDGDGDLVLSTGWYPATIRHFTNIGGSFGAGVDLDGGGYAMSDVQTADLDGDGDLDVLAGGGPDRSTVHWYENLGGAFAPEAALPVDHINSVDGLLAVDFEGDGDLDVVSVGNGITTYENLSECADLDADGDGLDDADELLVHGTLSDVADTDGDGASDGDEVLAGTDPLTG